MRKSTGRENNREWVQYGFKFKSKNHSIVIQRTWNDTHTNPQWYTFHLEGRGREDAIYTIKEAPLSLRLAEDFARHYVKEYTEHGEPIILKYDVTHKRKIRVHQVIKREEN